MRGLELQKGAMKEKELTQPFKPSFSYLKSASPRRRQAAVVLEAEPQAGWGTAQPAASSEEAGATTAPRLWVVILAFAGVWNLA